LLSQFQNSIIKVQNQFQGSDTTRDSVHAVLTPGEGVMPVDRMKEYRPAFDAIFDRKIPADLINSIALNPNILTEGQEATTIVH
jgi:hypothetical protein